MVNFAVISPRKPQWLKILLKSKFFVPCFKHQNLRKNDINVFCIDCNRSVCQHCLSAHSFHQLLQVRRYVYHDVIRLQDIQNHLDCSQVQTYTINGAKVLFLNPRPQSKPPKCTGRYCEICDRSLAEPHRYCSIACKASGVLEKIENRTITLLAEEPSSPESAVEIPNDHGQWLDSILKPKKPLHKRKGIPRRAPVC